MSLVLECWQTCSMDRPVVPVGMAGSIRGEIPYTSIRSWAQDTGLSGDDVLAVAQVIRTLDADRTERIHTELASKG